VSRAGLQSRTSTACARHTALPPTPSRAVAGFPVAVTQRGAKHLRELAHLARDGIRAVQLYCVNLSGIEAVRPAQEIDSAYAQALREAVACGVEVLAYGVRLTHEEMVVDRRLEVLLGG